MSRTGADADRAATIGGGIAAAVAIWVLIRWHAGAAGGVGTSYPATLVLLLSGLALIAWPRRRPVTLWLSAGITVIMATQLIVWISGIDEPLDSLWPQAIPSVADPHPGRVPLGTALLVLLAGIALVLLAQARPPETLESVPTDTGLFIAVVNGLVLLAWAVDPAVLEHALFLGHASPLAALALLGIGLALWRAGAERGSTRTPAALPATWAVLGLVLASFMLFHTLEQREARQAREDTELSAAQIARVLDIGLDDRVNAFRRLTDRWGAMGGVPDEELWALETDGYLRDLEALSTIIWLDADGRIQRINRRQGQQPLAEAGDAFEFDGTRSALLARALARREPELAGIVELRSGDPGILLVAPVFDMAGTHLGSIAATLRADQLLQSLVPEALPGMHFSIRDENFLVFSDARPDAEGIAPESGIVERLVRLSEADTLQLQVWSDLETWRLNQTSLPSLALALGLASALLLTLLSVYSGSLRRQSTALQANRRELEAEVILRRDAQRAAERSAALNQVLLESRNEIFEQSLDMICTVNAAGEFVTISRACEAILGYGPGELTGRRFMDFVHPDDVPRTEQEAAQIMAGIPTVSFENRYQRRDGQIVHLNWSARWSFDQHLMFAVARDITERKRREALGNLQSDILHRIATEQPTDTVLDAIVHFVESHDPGLLCSIMLSADDGLLHPAHSQRLPAAFVASLTDGVPPGPEAGSCGTAVWRGEAVIAADIGTDPLWQAWRPAALAAGLQACWSWPILGPDGKAFGALAIYRGTPGTPDAHHVDLLELASRLATIALQRARVRHALEHSLERLEAAQEIARLGYWEHVVRTDSFYVSKQVFAIFGQPPDPNGSLEITQLRQAVHPDDRQRLTRFREALEAEPVTREAEFRIVRPDGATRHVVMRATSRAGPRGDVVFISGTTQDMTEQRELDRELRTSRQRLLDALHVARLGSWEFYPEQGRLVLSDEHLAIMGLTREDAPQDGMEFLRYLHPDDHERIATLHAGLVRQPRPVDTEYRIVRPDGSIRYVHGRGDVEHADPGQPVRLFGTTQDITERRLLEIERQQAAMRYRLSIEQTDSVVYEYWLTSGHIAWSGAYTTLLGYDEDEIATIDIDRWAALIHPDDRAEALRQLETSVGTREPYQAEYRMRHRDGHYVPVLDRGRLIGNAGQPEASMLGVLINLTALREREQALRDSETRFRLAAERSGGVVYEVDLAKGHVEWAGAAGEILDANTGSAGDMTLDEWVARIHPDDRGDFERLMRGNTRGRRFRRVFRMRRGTAYFDAELSGAALTDAQEQTIRVIGTLFDVTERRALEDERLRYVRQLTQLTQLARRVQTFETVGDLMQHVTDEMREIFGAHQAVTSLTVDGKWAQAISAISLSDKYAQYRSYTTPPDGTGIYAMVAETNTAVRMTQAELEQHPRWQGFGRHAAEHPPMNGWLAAPMIGRSGENLGLLQLSDKKHGEFSDTELQLLSQLAGLLSVAIENLKVYQTLEERVTQRTRELETSNRELEAFSYSVSHDLRAPLRAIAGFAERLRLGYADRLDGEGLRYLERMVGGTHTMARLIDDLLSLSRVSRAQLQRAPLDLAALGRSIVDRYLERHPQQRVELAFGPDLKVHGDAQLVELMLTNLLENALKFSSTRAVSRITFERVTREGETAFCIGDNGVGFDMSHAGNLFGPFQRLHSAHEFPGTGVGLAIVRRIVERHGGRVSAEAAPDRGARFFFTLAQDTQG